LFMVCFSIDCYLLQQENRRNLTGKLQSFFYRNGTRALHDNLVTKSGSWIAPHSLPPIVREEVGRKLVEGIHPSRQQDNPIEPLGIVTNRVEGSSRRISRGDGQTKIGPNGWIQTGRVLQLIDLPREAEPLQRQAAIPHGRCSGQKFGWRNRHDGNIVETQITSVVSEAELEDRVRCRGDCLELHKSPARRGKIYALE